MGRWGGNVCAQFYTNKWQCIKIQIKFCSRLYANCSFDCADFYETHTHAKRLNVEILCIELHPDRPLYMQITGIK